MSAADRFYTALDRLIEAGGSLPCWDRSAGNPWLSESADEREYAATLCHHCPLIQPCAAMAHEARATHGVHGGLDFTQRPGKRRADPRALAGAGPDPTPCQPRGQLPAA